MTPRYRELQPGGALARFVHRMWLFEGDEAEVQRIVPDGCCELIVHFGTPYMEIGGTRQPRALFAGQLTRPLHLKPMGRTGVIALRFRSAAARAFTGCDLAALTDARAPLDTLHSKKYVSALVRTIRAASSDNARFAALQDYAAARIAEHPSAIDAVIEDCVARLQRGATPEQLCRQAGLTPRALQRRFARAVGVSSRQLSSIFRFRRVFDALRGAGPRNWTAAAQAAGYFDHPQMARDFRRFVGCTAREFMQGDEGLAASIARA